VHICSNDNELLGKRESIADGDETGQKSAIPDSVVMSVAAVELPSPESSTTSLSDATSPKKAKDVSKTKKPTKKTGPKKQDPLPADRSPRPKRTTTQKPTTGKTAKPRIGLSRLR
jgi:hypothetical protein